MQGEEDRRTPVDPHSRKRVVVRRTSRTGQIVQFARSMMLLAGLSIVLGCVGVAKPQPKTACLVLTSSSTLNLYGGQPHPLTVFVYPLGRTEGFEEANVDDLLAGLKPAGVLAPPVPITMIPGEIKRNFRETFPAKTTHLGVIADYDRAPDESAGSRRVVVPSRCLYWKPKLYFSSKDVEVD